MSYYERHIFFCLNQRDNGEDACAQHGAKDGFDRCKARVKAEGLAGPGGVRVNKAGCLVIHELDHIAGHPNATFRIYAIVAIIRYLLKRINPTSTWAQRMSEQVAAFPAIPGLSVEQSGFPPNWRIEALWH